MEKNQKIRKRKVKISSKRNGEWLMVEVNGERFGATTRMVMRQLAASAVTVGLLPGDSWEKVEDRIRVGLVNRIQDNHVAEPFATFLGLSNLALAIMHEHYARQAEVAT